MVDADIDLLPKQKGGPCLTLGFHYCCRRRQESLSPKTDGSTADNDNQTIQDHYSSKDSKSIISDVPTLADDYSDSSWSEGDDGDLVVANFQDAKEFMIHLAKTFLSLLVMKSTFGWRSYLKKSEELDASKPDIEPVPALNL